MKIHSFLVCLATILGVSTAGAFIPGGKPSTFNSAQGTIHLRELGVLVSKSANANVRVESVRWPMDPTAFLVYFESAGTLATYTMNITVNESRESKCFFVINTEKQYAFFLECEGPESQWTPQGPYPLRLFMTEIKIPATSR